MARQTPGNAYWTTNLRTIIALLVLWCLVSFGCGILWVDPLDQLRIAGFGLGFWFANQGSILVFCLLIAIYSHRMNRLDDQVAARDPD